MWTAHMQYPCSAASPSDARRFCCDELENLLGSDRAAQAVVDDAQLIVSELITNAVNAECSRTGLTLECDGNSLRIAVRDDGPGRPTLRSANERDEHGRGLAIIAAIAASWGVCEADPGKQVWAELTIPPALAS
jgi:anti-sigma regulatory factor (Ser/Thr protein kinase)